MSTRWGEAAVLRAIPPGLAKEPHRACHTFVPCIPMACAPAGRGDMGDLGEAGDAGDSRGGHSRREGHSDTDRACLDPVSLALTHPLAACHAHQGPGLGSRVPPGRMTPGRLRVWWGSSGRRGCRLWHSDRLMDSASHGPAVNPPSWTALLTSLPEAQDGESRPCLAPQPTVPPHLCYNP